MLKTRILTASVLVILFLLLLFKMSAFSFYIVTSLIVLLASWEWSALMGISNFPRALCYPAIMFFALIAALWISIPVALIIAGISWIGFASLVFIYPRLSSWWGESRLVRGMMGMLVLVPCWLALNFMRNEGTSIILFLLILVCSADVSAYFVGRKWGKTKLAPAVSPNKSWQGVLGAFLGTLIVGLLGAWWSNLPTPLWPYALLLTLITVFFSIIGDLFESMLKRNVDIKDSGFLLPGHGGILDRLDSLTAAAPIFALGAWLLGKSNGV